MSAPNKQTKQIEVTHSHQRQSAITNQDEIDGVDKDKFHLLKSCQ